MKTYMKEVKDIFSGHSHLYKSYRPLYPEKLYKLILSHSKGFDQAWDVGTGNGQIANELSHYFRTVFGTDISANQMTLAVKSPNIFYMKCRAEYTPFPNRSFDLITIGQALHWFDFDAFNKEVKRVSRQETLLAAWGYGLFQIESSVQKIIEPFYSEIVGPYWDPERVHIETEYRNIPLEINEIEGIEPMSIDLEWGYDEMRGYLSSWSAVQKYMEAEKTNPLLLIEEELQAIFEGVEKVQVSIPLFFRLGYVKV